MFKYLKKLCSTGLSQLEYDEIYHKLQDSNRKNLVTFSTITAVIMFIMTIVALINLKTFDALTSVASKNLIAYIVTFVMVVGILIYAKHSKKNIFPVLYIFMGIVLFFGILIGTITNPENTAGCYVALLLVVPLVFVDKPIRNIALICISNAIFIPMVFMFKPQATWANDLINSVAFGVVSIFMSSYLMKIKLSEFRNEMVISKLANTDMMTKLYNRNYFEQKLAENNYNNNQSCFCIYVDVNGLHELNNAKGHWAGDKMLIFIAKTLGEMFKDSDVYRLGGDEFMVFGINKTQTQLNNIADEICKTVTSQGYSLSIGLEYQEDGCSNMEAMVKSAEIKMLLNKQKFYEQNGFKRKNFVNA